MKSLAVVLLVAVAGKLVVAQATDAQLLQASWASVACADGFRCAGPRLQTKMPSPWGLAPCEVTWQGSPCKVLRRPFGTPSATVPVCSPTGRATTPAFTQASPALMDPQ